MVILELSFLKRLMRGKKNTILLCLAGRYCTKQTGLASNSNFTSELLSYTQSFEICVMARGEKGANANGFNWKKETEECRGVIDATVIDTKQTKWESCIFTGELTK